MLGLGNFALNAQSPRRAPTNTTPKIHYSAGLIGHFVSMMLHFIMTVLPLFCASKTRLSTSCLCLCGMLVLLSKALNHHRVYSCQLVLFGCGRVMLHVGCWSDCLFYQLRSQIPTRTSCNYLLSGQPTAWLTVVQSFYAITTISPSQLPRPTF